MTKLHWHDSRRLRQPAEFYEMLDGIRRRPGMYFGGSCQIHALDGFLMGYEAATALWGHDASLGLGTPFSEWLVRTKQLKGGANLGWTAILTLNFGSPEKVFDAFFDLFHEYHGTPNPDQAPQVGDPTAGNHSV